jgi:hypothetical protein
MSSPDTVDALSVSTVLGGRTAGNRGWVEAIRDLRHDIIQHRVGVTSDIHIDVEFHVPGNILSPDYEGLRTGSFRKADRLLKVQVALPEIAPSEPRAELLALLDQAVVVAEEWAKRRRITLDPQPLRGIVEAVRQA